MPATALEYTTNGTAAAAIASPAILPHIEGVSQMAALWLPILGAVWLVVQIYSKIRGWFNGD